MAGSLLLSFSSTAKAQNIPDDEGVIVVDITSNTTEQGPKRSPAIIPIAANYYVLSSCLEVIFLYDIGVVTISVTNSMNGSFSSTVVDSQYGSTLLPLFVTSGLWVIDFFTYNGDHYSGYFSIL